MTKRRMGLACLAALVLDARVAVADPGRVVSAWLPPWLPDWALAAAAWILQPTVLTLLAIISALLFALSLVGLPLVLTRIPADFFSRPERRRLRLAEQKRPLWFVVLRGLRNALGYVLLALGLLMLFVPGPGGLTLLAGLMLVDFPGKRRLQRWVISRPTVHRPVNALRRRAGRPLLELPVPAEAKAEPAIR